MRKYDRKMQKHQEVLPQVLSGLPQHQVKERLLYLLPQELGLLHLWSSNCPILAQHNLDQDLQALRLLVPVQVQLSSDQDLVDPCSSLVLDIVLLNWDQVLEHPTGELSTLDLMKRKCHYLVRWTWRKKSREWITQHTLWLMKKLVRWNFMWYKSYLKKLQN